MAAGYWEKFLRNAKNKVSCFSREAASSIQCVRDKAEIRGMRELATDAVVAYGLYQGLWHVKSVWTVSKERGFREMIARTEVHHALVDLPNERILKELVQMQKAKRQLLEKKDKVEGDDVASEKKAPKVEPGDGRNN